MPYARVGVIPTLSTKNDQQSSQMSGGKRSARRKGITMEDLKRLTALRLAQEQHQQPPQTNPSAFAEYSLNGVTTPVNDLSAFNLPNNEVAVVQMQMQPPMVAPREVIPSRPSPGVFVVVNPIDANRSAILPGPAPDVQDSHALAAIKQTSNIKQAKKVLQKAVVALAPLAIQSPAAPEVAQPVLVSQEQRFQQRSPEVPSSRSSQAGSPSLDSSYPGSSQTNSSKSKLPHGLTVHELKEMTKARLQAEAAESNETVPFQQPRGSPSPRLASPNQHLFMHSVESPSQIHTVHEHHPDVYPPPSPAFGNYGSSMQLNSVLSEVSESEFGNNFDRNRGMNQNRECWQQQSKTDAWETASAASYNSAVASDYMGSEAPFTPVVGGLSTQMVDELGNVPFSRSRSYPTSGGFSVNSDYQLYEGIPPNGSSSFGNVYVAVGPNRRRACTLSPRPGLGNLHEDRPMLSCEGLGMPTFAAGSTRNQINPRVPNSYSPILSNSQYPESFRPFGNFNDSIGRPRTLSTASLPPISHTADEFALEGQQPSQLHYTMGPPISQGFSDPRNSMMDGFLRSTTSSLPSSMNAAGGVSGVFRDSGLGDDLRDPPGLFGGSLTASSSTGLNLVQSSTSSMDTFGDSKGKLDSTWGASHGSVFPLGTGMIQSQSDPMDATLAGDLNSILKLSGAAEEPDMPPSRTGFSDINGMSNRPFGF